MINLECLFSSLNLAIWHLHLSVIFTQMSLLHVPSCQKYFYQIWFGERLKNSQFGFLPNRMLIKMLLQFNYSHFLIKPLISFSYNQPLDLCINTCAIVFNKSVFNWTFCQLLTKNQLYKKICCSCSNATSNCNIINLWFYFHFKIQIVEKNYLVWETNYD